MPSAIVDTRTLPRATEDQWRLGLECAFRKITPPRSSIQINDPRETPVPSIGHQALAKAGIKHLSAIIEEANDLLENPFEDEDGDPIRTTKFAHGLCCQLLIDAAIKDAIEFRSGAIGRCVAIPEGVVSSDERGGIRVEWVRETASVHLVIPSNETAEPYVYVEANGRYSTERATPESLALALRNID